MADVKPRIGPILREEAVRHGYTVEQLLDRFKNKRISHVRQYAMWRARTETGRPYTEIARMFNRDHSTIIHAVEKMENMSPESRATVPEIMARRETATFMGSFCINGHGRLRYVNSGKCVTCARLNSMRFYASKTRKAAE